MKSRWIFFVLAVATGVRLAWVMGHEVSPVDAYYWACAQHPAAAYFDGPPGVALVVMAFGGSMDFVRLFWPVLALACSLAAWFFVRQVYDARGAAFVVLLLNALPVFNRASVELGPWLPALFLILAGLVFVRAAWGGWVWGWLVGGILFAGAAAFRYEAVLVPLGIWSFALASSGDRKPATMLGVGVGVVLMAGVLWLPMAWNAGLEWIPISGRTFRSLWEFDCWRFLVAGGSVLSGLGGLAGVCLVGVLVLLVRRARGHGKSGFLLASCACVWVWAAYLVVRGGDAAGVALLGFVPVAMYGVHELAAKRWFREAYLAVVVLALLLPVREIGGSGTGSWAAVARELQKAAFDLPATEGGGFFIAEDPQMAAVLAYHLRGEQVFVPESQDLSSQFALWPSYADFVESDQVVNEFFTEQKGVNPYVGRNAIFIGKTLPQAIKGAFTETRPVVTLKAPLSGELTIYLCLGYETLPL